MLTFPEAMEKADNLLSIANKTTDTAIASWFTRQGEAYLKYAELLLRRKEDERREDSHNYIMNQRRERKNYEESRPVWPL